MLGRVAWWLMSQNVQSCWTFYSGIRKKKKFILSPGFIMGVLLCSESCAGIGWWGWFFLSSGLNSEFSFSLTGCLTKIKEPSLSYNLSIAGEKIAGFIPFLGVLVVSEMLTASFRIWTQVAISISHNDNCNATNASSFLQYLQSHILFHYVIMNTFSNFILRVSLCNG